MQTTFMLSDAYIKNGYITQINSDQEFEVQIYSDEEPMKLRLICYQQNRGIITGVGPSVYTFTPLPDGFTWVDDSFPSLHQSSNLGMIYFDCYKNVSLFFNKRPIARLENKRQILPIGTPLPKTAERSPQSLETPEEDKQKRSICIIPRRD